MFSSVDKPIHTMLVTSAARDDEKSLAVANVAVTFAQSGIVLSSSMPICDSHSSTAFGAFKAVEALTNMMVDDTAISDPPLSATSIENLEILATGELPPNPADLLSGKRMDEIIAALKARADYVLLTVHLYWAATDAALLGIKLDAALLVVKAGDTRRDHTAQARQALERVHVRIVGAVLVNAPGDDRIAY